LKNIGNADVGRVDVIDIAGFSNGDNSNFSYHYESQMTVEMDA
jgi:hypothetical protein